MLKLQLSKYPKKSSSLTKRLHDLKQGTPKDIQQIAALELIIFEQQSYNQILETAMNFRLDEFDKWFEVEEYGDDEADEEKEVKSSTEQENPSKQEL